MVSLSLKAQADGSRMDEVLVIGAPSAYEAVDDSNGTDHDGDGSYVQIQPGLSGAVYHSFRFFSQAEHLRPLSFSVNVAAAQLAGKAALVYSIGLKRRGDMAFDGAGVTTTSLYVVSTRTFPSDPITGLPWDSDSLPDLEVVLRGNSGFGKVSLISVSPFTGEAEFAAAAREIFFKKDAA